MLSPISSGTMDRQVTQRRQARQWNREEPLFVLRYQRRRMILPIMFSLIIIPICVFGPFLAAESAFGFIMGMAGAVITLLSFLPGVADMLLLKEIRFYRDKIVKEWKFTRLRELELAEAGLSSKVSSAWGLGKKWFFEHGKNSAWERILSAFFFTTGISYQEHFADRRQVKQLNSLLAELSGRKIEEFEKSGIMERLIRKET